MPREQFGSSLLVSSVDCRKVQQQELAAKLDGNFAAKLNAIAHVMLYTHGRAYIEIYTMINCLTINLTNLVALLYSLSFASFSGRFEAISEI